MYWLLLMYLRGLFVGETGVSWYPHTDAPCWILVGYQSSRCDCALTTGVSKSTHVREWVETSKNTLSLMHLLRWKNISLLWEQIIEADIRSIHSEVSSPNCNLSLSIFPHFFYVHLISSKYWYLSVAKSQKFARRFLCPWYPVYYASPHSSRGGTVTH